MDTEKRIRLAVIVISYNRPKMIRECLASIDDANQIIIADDGSDFNVSELKYEFNRAPGKTYKYDSWVTIAEPRVSPQERALNPRMGKIINLALSAVNCDLVTYICDDDIFAPNWLSVAKDFFSKYPEFHVVKGIAKNVKDIHDLTNSENSRVNDWQLVTGNFVHRIECFKDEGVEWDENIVVNGDHEFLTRMNKVHAMNGVPKIELDACYRRVHPGNLSNFIGENYSEDRVKEMLNRKWQE